VALLVTVRETEPRGLTVAEKPRSYPLVVFFSIFSIFFFYIKSLLCLKVQKTHAALAMEIKNL